MLGTLIGIILALVVLGVLWWALQKILAVFPIAEPFRTVIYVVCVVVAVLIVIAYVVVPLLHMAGIHVPMRF